MTGDLRLVVGGLYILHFMLFSDIGKPVPCRLFVRLRDRSECYDYLYSIQSDLNVRFRWNGKVIALHLL